MVISAGLIGARVLDLPLAYQVLRAEGSGLGCAAIWLIGADECPVRLALDVMHYFEQNNARQCGPCLRGTAAMSATLDRLAAGTPAADDLDRLGGWSVSLLGRGACGYLDGAATLPATLLREFPRPRALPLRGPVPNSLQLRPATGCNDYE